MTFITIDGDNIGQKISACYLANNVNSLKFINDLVQGKVKQVSDFLEARGFTIIFCAADGVAGFCEQGEVNYEEIYQSIENIAGKDITFSAGVGNSLREAYISLLFAKSNGKSRLCYYQEVEECSE